MVQTRHRMRRFRIYGSKRWIWNLNSKIVKENLVLCVCVYVWSLCIRKGGGERKVEGPLPLTACVCTTVVCTDYISEKRHHTISS